MMFAHCEALKYPLSNTSSFKVWWTGFTLILSSTRLSHLEPVPYLKTKPVEKAPRRTECGQKEEGMNTHFDTNHFTETHTERE